MVNGPNIFQMLLVLKSTAADYGRHLANMYDPMTKVGSWLEGMINSKTIENVHILRVNTVVVPVVIHPTLAKFT